MFALAVFLAVFSLVAYRFDGRGQLQAALVWIETQGVWGLAIFICLYICATIFLLPGSLLTLGGGAVFGLLWGTVAVSVGSTIGATCAFLLGRYFTRDWIADKVAENPSFAAIDQAVGQEGWKIVLLTRLSPVFPFNLLNYAFGLTRVSLTDYLLASWVGMLPGTVMYVYLGTLVGELARLGERGREREPAEWVLLIIGLLATIAVAVYITKISKQALENKAIETSH